MTTLQMDGQQTCEQETLARAFEAFNQTSEYLSRSYHELQERVAVLTGELATANRRLNEELRSKDALSRRLAALIEALPGGVLVLDSDGRIIECNPAATRLLGANLTGERWDELRSAVLVATQTADEWRLGPAQDARRINVASRQLDAAGATVLLINDITEQYRAQQQENRRQKLASMGEMTANLAHQLRTPLATCLLYAAPLGNGAITSEQRRDFHTRLLAGIRHLERLVRDMLTFVRGRETAREAVSAAELLQEALQMMEPQALCRGVQLRVLDQAGVASVTGCRKSLVGALYNLLDNALFACGQGGHIELRASLDGDKLCLSVRDDGAGISPQVRSRLFEPFFTTRADGNGLGLSIVRSVARAHGGDIDVAAASDQGSEFVISLPLAANIQVKELHHA